MAAGGIGRLVPEGEMLAAGRVMLCKEARQKDVGRSSREQEACLLDAEKCTPRVFAFKKPKLQKKSFAINELAAASGVKMEAGGGDRLKMLAGWCRNGRR